MESNYYLAGVEAGGTGITIAIAKGVPSNIIESTYIPTTAPDETKEKVVEWLRQKKFDSLGVASFGPIDLDRNSKTYGYITTTPKPNWENTNILGWFDEFDVPKDFDTDCNGAAISECFHNQHKRGPVSSCVYITVGTGVGIGVVVGEKSVHGLVHPEGGHSFARLLPDDQFPGTCPFHGNCIEGLVSTGAIAKRLGVSPDKLAMIPDDDPVWSIVGHYLAQLCANLILISSPEIIVLGGGVMNRSVLFPIIGTQVLKILNGYIKSPYLTEELIDQYIVLSPFEHRSGIVGALELARRMDINNCKWLFFSIGILLLLCIRNDPNNNTTNNNNNNNYKTKDILDKRDNWGRGFYNSTLQSSIINSVTSIDTSGGTITIYGSNFGNSTHPEDLSVSVFGDYLDGSFCTNISIVNDNVISCQMPSGVGSFSIELLQDNLVFIEFKHTFNAPPLEKIVDVIESIARDNPNGFTLDIITFKKVLKGISVAYLETQDSFDRKGLEKVVRHSQTIGNNVVGGWLNDHDENKKYYYDSVKIFLSTQLDQAIQFGQLNQQLAIFDISNLNLISL
ncbi:hypothetical protein DFA_05366 [Cavenderia fasciculata]|uniref:fructokinase n=1 Tax=Cavenderia fasciculata TaxID=261658 RepID=F4PL12_CACFS|nr:uncharacterized protein DFA_05366 [Cavenderia fasciculata]EGG23234.1 hypothetical protein DFA_05366 [Cavenderia fasciculata]|eukprot:XP_004361085.1 hypothetical protein DFA_05366 [Cavenderia fasciculata]